MKIVYAAFHDYGQNDDEGAIAYGLQRLGHTVYCVHERVANAVVETCRRERPDLLLFHKWLAPGADNALRQIDCPKVFWWFDLVWFPDPRLAGRCQSRVDWMNRFTPLVDAGFMSDGDWVAGDKSGKLNWLTQGADERIIGDAPGPRQGTTLLFAGRRDDGFLRASFIDEISAKFPDGNFIQLQGVYRERLREQIGNTKICLAPDGPVTDRYWSNRVYLMLGFGGFLLHPYCERLAEQYTDGEHLVFYRSRQDLFEKIDYYLGAFELAGVRNKIAAAALRHTAEWHTYRARCAALLAELKRRGITK